jgi:hypothetical protein
MKRSERAHAISPRLCRGILTSLAVSSVLAISASFAADKPADAAKKNAAPAAEYTTEKLRGKVVWLEDALKRRFGVATEPDADQTSVVLETADGSLVPILPDTRGRAFAVDGRLRDTELVLLARRYKKAPMIQVIRVMRPTDKGLLEVDYWCDICAIPMYILKPCECCQGETRLRERPMDEVFEPESKGK